MGDRTWIKGLAAASVSLTLIGCTQPAATPNSAGAGSNPFAAAVGGTLRTSGFNPSDEVGQSRADYAASKLQGLTISMDKTNFDAQKFAAQAAAGQAPDLVQLDRNVVPTFAAKGLILPLDQCYATQNVKPNEQYYPSTIKDVSYDGAVYAVPQFFQATALLANKRVLKKAQVTAEQVDTSKPAQILDVAKKLYAASGGKPSVLGFDPDAPGSANIWFTVFGGRMYGDDGAPMLDDPKNVEALTWMKQLLDAQGGYAKVKSFKDSMDVFGKNNQYVADQVGVQTWAQWYPNVLANTASKVAIQAIPIKSVAGKTLAVAGGTSFAVPKAGKNPAAACAWAIQATSTEAWMAAGAARAETVKKNQTIATGLMTASPVANQAVKEKFVQPSGNADFDQVIETYYSILPDNTSLGSSAIGQQAKQELDNAVVVTLTGEKSPQQALTDAQAAAQRAWQQR